MIAPKKTNWLPVFCSLGLVVLLYGYSMELNAEDRFPRPEFQSGYHLPHTVFPPSRPAVFAYIDVAVLLGMLSLASWAALRLRSRRVLFITMCTSLAYFGFYRKGCICPVGAVQNITTAFFNSSYVVPVSVVMLFVLPLVFTLLFGRTFCSSVCPLGGIQDFILLKPKQLPVWLERALSIIPHLYLGTAILFAATGAGFIICRFDPFVGIFRRSVPVTMVLWSGGLLVAGIFIARPYCRFFCPYGVLLGWMSRLSWRHATITPDTCINCRLCEDACPFNAILPPTPLPDTPHRRSLNQVISGMLLVPAWILFGIFLGYSTHDSLSQFHPDVRLANVLQYEEQAQRTGLTIETQTFRSGTVSMSAQNEIAVSIKKRFKTGTILLGAYIGAVIGIMLLYHSLIRKRDSYIPDQGNCFSCGRCFPVCPQERLRLKKKTAMGKNDGQ